MSSLCLDASGSEFLMWGDGFLSGALVATSTDIPVVTDHTQHSRTGFPCAPLCFSGLRDDYKADRNIKN